mgnify:CR=1 FL=1
MGLAYNILTPAKAISKATYAVKSGMAAAQRVFEVLEVENAITDKANALVKESFDKEILIENIMFGEIIRLVEIRGVEHKVIFQKNIC